MIILDRISQAALRALRLVLILFLSVPGAGLALVAWSCGSDAPETAESRRVVASAPAASPEAPAPPPALRPALAAAPDAEIETAPSPPASPPRTLPPPSPRVVVEAPAEPAARPVALPRTVRAPAPDLVLVDSALATTVEEREPLGIAQEFSAGSDQVWAWVKLENRGEPTHVTFVWSHEGAPRGSATLEVGRSPSWRTWARKRTRPSDTGAWQVEILDARGKSLGILDFEVAPAPARVDGEAVRG